MNNMKPGFTFKNQDMVLTILDFAESEKSNVGLLLNHSDGMYITVRDLQLFRNQYVWYYGHYFTSIDDALKDYKERKRDL